MKVIQMSFTRNEGDPKVHYAVAVDETLSEIVSAFEDTDGVEIIDFHAKDVVMTPELALDIWEFVESRGRIPGLLPVHPADTTPTVDSPDDDA